MSYLVHLLPKDETLEADSCRVDGMASAENNEHEQCREVSSDSVRLFHFTSCRKPWSCPQHPPDSLCGHMMDKWWDIRANLQTNLTGKAGKKGCENGYEPLELIGKNQRYG